MSSVNFKHNPVMLEQCIKGLNIDPSGTYFDGTVGGGGHSFEIARRLTTGKLLCTDKDRDAVYAASIKLKEFGNVLIKEGDYKDVRSLFGLKDNTLNGALLDLGVSSYQLDNAERGFSYNKDGLLDMRMNRSGATAADIINTLEWQGIADILRRYGEEPHAALIARKIVSERDKQPITTSLQLNDVVIAALPAAARRKEKHPARRTFQALRIAVNDELGILEQGLDEIFNVLAPRGRLCVITFHSLEDRIVKHYMTSLMISCTCPPDFPQCVCGKSVQARPVTKKPMTASEEECEDNRRSRSAKLRIIEKI